MFLRRSIRAAHKKDASRRENIRFPRCSWSWGTMWLEERVMLSGGLQNTPGQVQGTPIVLTASVMNGAVPITIGLTVPGNIVQGGANFYQIQPSADGRLIAQAQAASASLELRLSLFDGQGNLLVQSDGQSIGRLDPLIDQHVSGGLDSNGVHPRGAESFGLGPYSLSTSLTPASDPGQTVALPPNFKREISRPGRWRLQQRQHSGHCGRGRCPPGNRGWDVSGCLRDRRPG